MSSSPIIVTARFYWQRKNLCGDGSTRYHGDGKTETEEVAPEIFFGILKAGNVGRDEVSAAEGRVDLVD